MTAARRWEQPFLPPGALDAAFEPLTTPALFARVQAAAEAHAAALGLGIEALTERGLTWMLARFRMRVRETLPETRRLVVTTWPSGSERLLALREFVVANPATPDEPFAVATSGWLLVGVDSRRPVRPGPFVDHLAVDKHVLSLRGKRLDRPTHIDWVHRMAVNQGDIDLNGHVSSTRYLEWAETALAHEAPLRGPWHEVEIDYISEVLAGQHVRTEGAANPDGSQAVAIVREEDGAIVAIARIRA